MKDGSHKRFTISIAGVLLMTVFLSTPANARTKKIPAFALKEMTLGMDIPCSAEGLSPDVPANAVYQVTVTPFSEIGPIELLSYDGSGRRYSVTEGEKVWLELESGESIRIGTIVPKLAEQVQFSPERCNQSFNKTIDAEVKAQFTETNKFVIAPKQLKKVCKSDWDLSFTGLRSYRIPYTIVDTAKEQILQKAEMDLDTYASCTSVGTILKGMAASAVTVIFLPVSIFALHHGD